MSERLFRFLLNELEVIRLRCTIASCTGAVEMHVASLKSGKHMPFVCPVCGNGASAGAGVSGALDDLGDAIERLKATGRANSFKVEFVLPESNP